MIKYIKLSISANEAFEKAKRYIDKKKMFPNPLSFLTGHSSISRYEGYIGNNSFTVNEKSNPLLMIFGPTITGKIESKNYGSRLQLRISMNSMTAGITGFFIVIYSFLAFTYLLVALLSKDSSLSLRPLIISFLIVALVFSILILILYLTYRTKRNSDIRFFESLFKDSILNSNGDVNDKKSN